MQLSGKESPFHINNQRSIPGCSADAVWVRVCVSIYQSEKNIEKVNNVVSTK